MGYYIICITSFSGNCASLSKTRGESHWGRTCNSKISVVCRGCGGHASSVASQATNAAKKIPVDDFNKKEHPREANGQIIVVQSEKNGAI